MKLRNLNAAIRKHSGSVGLAWNSPNGAVVIETGKTSLLAALKAGFGENNLIETGLTVTDGVLVSESPDADLAVRLDFLPSAGAVCDVGESDILAQQIEGERRAKANLLAAEESDLLDDDDLLLDDDGENAAEDEFDGLLD